MPQEFTRSCLGGLFSLVWAGFPVAPEGFNAVLGQLARWFYPFGSGAHCNNYYYSFIHVNGPARLTQTSKAVNNGPSLL